MQELKQIVSYIGSINEIRKNNIIAITNYTRWAKSRDKVNT